MSKTEQTFYQPEQDTTSRSDKERLNDPEAAKGLSPYLKVNQKCGGMRWTNS